MASSERQVIVGPEWIRKAMQGQEVAYTTCDIVGSAGQVLATQEVLDGQINVMSEVMREIGRAYAKHVEATWIAAGIATEQPVCTSVRPMPEAVVLPRLFGSVASLCDAMQEEAS